MRKESVNSLKGLLTNFSKPYSQRYLIYRSHVKWRSIKGVLSIQLRVLMSDLYGDSGLWKEHGIHVDSSS